MDWNTLLGVDFVKLVIVLMIVAMPGYIALLRDTTKGHNQLTEAIQLLTKSVDKSHEIIVKMTETIATQQEAARDRQASIDHLTEELSGIFKVVKENEKNIGVIVGALNKYG